VQILLYGIGQFAFSLGMFIAGSYGMGRKTYGVEQHLRNTGQTIGMWVMGGGGLVALAGGFTFVVIVLGAVAPKFRGFWTSFFNRGDERLEAR
jgi:hypothetical protein